MMNIHPYRILLGAGLALCMGSAGAQTGDSATYPTSDKNATQGTQAPASAQPGQQGMGSASPTDRFHAKRAAANALAESSPKAADKMSGDMNAQAQSADEAGTKMHAQKAANKPSRHVAKTASRHEQIATQGDRAYREALRQCAKEQNQNQRDTCLDNAIEQFQRNS
jgi:hypothetical protein